MSKNHHQFDKVMAFKDFTTYANHIIQGNKSDSVIKIFKEHKCYVIDLIIPSDKNISAKVFDKLSKYRDMKIEMSENTIIVLVVEEARRIFKKYTDTGIQKITGNASL